MYFNYYSVCTRVIYNKCDGSKPLFIFHSAANSYATACVDLTIIFPPGVDGYLYLWFSDEMYFWITGSAMIMKCLSAKNKVAIMVALKLIQTLNIYK